jgi:hypothetical protein
MKASAQSLLEAVQAHYRPQTGGVARAPNRAAMVRAYQADFETQLNALQEHMPILQLETRRRAVVSAQVGAVREMVETYEATSSLLEDAALILFANNPAVKDAVITALGEIQDGTEILISDLDKRQADSGLGGAADSLLASVTQHVATGDNNAQTAQFKQTFHSLLSSVQDYLRSLEESDTDEQGSAPANPSTFRLKLAQIRACENVAATLESVQEKLFDPDSKESHQITSALGDIEGRADALFNDTKVEEFEAEFTSLQATVDGLEKEIRHYSSIDSSAILPFWRRKNQQLVICDIRRNKLEETEDGLFGEHSDKSPKIQAGLSAMEDRIDALITDVMEKADDIRDRSAIPEAAPNDMDLAFRFNRMSTFGSLPEEQ